MKTKRIPVPANWKDLKTHPLAMLIGYGLGIDTVKLAEHMREHGYDDSEPIVIFDGQIFDGRHRHVGAQEADVIPSFAELVEGSLTGYIAKKLNRQHLNESQRAYLLAALKKSRPEASEGNHYPLTETTISEDAEAADVSRKTMVDANKVASEASPEVQAAVASGDVPVNQAAAVVRSVFCRNCRIHGPKKKCQDCIAKRKEMGVSVLNKPPKAGTSKPKKIGAEKFDWKEFDKHLGFVVRGRTRSSGPTPLKDTAMSTTRASGS